MRLHAKGLIAIALFFCSLLLAQDKVDIGERHLIKSELLQQNRVLDIYLPSSHQTSQKKYPVLFILDGQWHFANGVAIQKSLRVPDRLPEMIVVGIHSENPLRLTLFGNEREKFLSFLQEEVIPYINANFKATDERILFGWEAAAIFSGYAILHKSQLFNGAIMTNGAYVTQQMIEEFLELDPMAERYLFIANTDKDIYSVRGSDAFAELLGNKAPATLIWKYEKFNDEIHESLPYLALYHGLNHYFHNYQSLVFANIEEFHNLGGIPYLKSYYLKRGKRFGLDPKIDNSVKNALIWLSWNRDDFESFQFFMDAFKDVLTTKRYTSAYWQNRFGQFYLKHGDYENAIHYFKIGISQYPERSWLAKMHNGLGKAYFKKGNQKLAKSNLKKAMEIARKNKDAQFEDYKKDFTVLRK
ncbi:MAG: alpha/beta hydrolase-fold protein [Bacteroidota bacterium]